MKNKKIIMTIAVVACVLGLLLVWRHAREKNTYRTPASYYVAFDDSMQLAKHPINMGSGHAAYGQQVYAIFKHLYEKKNLARVSYQSNPAVPKRIHQIWLGSPFPEKYRAFQASWKKQHPDWEYYLWTDAELKDFKLHNRDLYDASTNYGEKSDIARYEILYQLGGLYIDTDFECLKPFDMFNHCYDFYIGIQPLDTSFVQLGIGLIGSSAGHPMLRQVIDNMHANAQTTRAIIKRTGPLYFTQVFCAIAPQLSGNIVALPSSYFYPKSYDQKDDTTGIWMRPESFAVHHWEASWLKPEAFVARHE